MQPTGLPPEPCRASGRSPIRGSDILNDFRDEQPHEAGPGLSVRSCRIRSTRSGGLRRSALSSSGTQWPRPYLAAASLGLALSLASAAHAQNAKQKAFERVFGDAVKLDPAMVAKVKAGKSLQYFFIDRNNDGKNDEVWFIDPSPRHMPHTRPVLVRVIDEDGDMDHDKGPDLDSDLYVADWNADGVVDVVLDYQDNDGDNDLDEMGFYFFVSEHPFFGKNVLYVWWGRDDGDDNLLWYDVSYTYNQTLCQYRCHFSGVEQFVAFGLREGENEWTPAFENPFTFYDPDGDLCSEVVIRYEGRANRVQAVRYSFDADDDAYGRRTHDYEFSITSIAPGIKYLKKDNPEMSDLVLPEEMTESTKLRGIPTGKWIRREHAQPFAQQAQWARQVLTWDEMNANTEGDVNRDPWERWEGVIARSSQHFPQIGGPPCSALNKRNEVSMTPVAPMRLYYDPADRRLHLRGANEGWLMIDYDLDGKPDAKITYVDENKDGTFDRRELDLDADGKSEFSWNMGQGERKDVELDWEKLTQFYKPMLVEALADSQAFIDAAKAALSGGSADRTRDPVETFFLEKLESWMPVTRLGERMRKTPAGARLYVDLLRDRLLYSLKKAHGQHAAWSTLESRYASGDYKAAAEILVKELTPRAKPEDGKTFGQFTHRIALTFDNSAQPQRDDYPVTIAVSAIRAVAADFNPDNCAVVAPERWIDWRQIPHQVDQIDATVGKELSFLIDTRANSSATYYLYYSPTGKSDKTFPAKTATAEDWVPPNIGWESNRCAYRAYWGQFDFFGKKVDGLIYPTIGKQSYHDEVSWGIDALNVKETSGLGGLTLYLDDRAYLVQNPAGKGNVTFTKKQVTAGPIRAAVEILAENVVPTKPDIKVRLQCLIYAERQETEIRATVTGAEGEIILAPGFIKLSREEGFAEAGGYAGLWGFQEPVIGDIGLGIIVSPSTFVDHEELPNEHRAKFRAEDGKLRYWLIGDWRRGRRHPVCPTVDNWRRELNALSEVLLNELKPTIGQVEKLR